MKISSDNIEQELKTLFPYVEEVRLSDDLVNKARSRRNEIIDNSQYVRVFRLTYKFKDQNIAGFIVIPNDFKNKKKLPLVVYNRGGSFDFSLVSRGLLFSDLATLARYGYIVVGSQYPGNQLSDGHDTYGGLPDLQAVSSLIDTTKLLRVVDSAHIAMIGFSRGGMMTYLLLAQRSDIKTAIIINGLADLIRNAKMRPEMQDVYQRSFGGSLVEKHARSVLHNDTILKIASIPILLIHGKNDRQVSLLDSQEVYVAISAQSDKHTIITYQDNHSLSQYRDSWLKETKSWLNKNLGS